MIGMASLYAEAIARGHVFNDANKRTALTCAIAYIEQQGLHVRQNPVLAEATVMLAEGRSTRDDFAAVLSSLLSGARQDMEPGPWGSGRHTKCVCAMRGHATQAAYTSSSERKPLISIGLPLGS
nr:hypothetical protein [Verminephrobacter eiseniae]